MVIIIITVLRVLIMCYVLPDYPENGNNNCNDWIQIEKLDISEKSLILDIMKDVVSETEDTAKNHVFSLYLSDFKSGIKVDIIEQMDDCVYDNDKLLGYLLIGNDTVVVYGKFIPDLSVSKKSQSVSLRKQGYIKTDFPEWHYLIKDGVFARDAESMSWMWHIPKDRLKDYKISKYIVTVPLRTKK